MMRRLYIVMYALLLLPVLLQAGGQRAEGEYGWKMLTIPPNTATLAMAGTGGTASVEATSFLVHPTAGLMSRTRAVSISQNNWLFGSNINSVAINLPQGTRSLGFALRTVDYGKFDARDISGEIIGEFHPLDLNLAANYAFRLNPDLYAGVNIFLLYQKIDSSSSLGMAADVGATYVTPLSGLDLNLAVKHFGLTGKVKDESIKMPVTPEVGIIYNIPFALFADGMGQGIHTEVKALKHPDDDEIKVQFGASVPVTSAFNLRFGYRLNYDSHTWSSGIGLALRRLVFDYAYLPFEFDGNDAHSFGLTYRF